MSLKTVRLDSHVRRKLIWYSILGGVFITILAIALRSAGIYRPVPYLTYSGSYLMQAFFQGFLEWIPWKYADNLKLTKFSTDCEQDFRPTALRLTVRQTETFSRLC